MLYSENRRAETVRLFGRREDLQIERAFRSREQALRDGIEIDCAVYEALKSLYLD